jgi:polyhydroxybutyrate depolymerase
MFDFRVLSMFAVLALIAVGCGDDDDADTTDSTSTDLDSAAATVEPTPTATSATTLPVAASAGCDSGSDPVGGPATFTHDGLKRTYVLSVPTVNSGDPAPLLFDFHGFGGSPESQEATSGFGEIATARGYIVITPQGEPLTVSAATAGGRDTGDVDGIKFWNIFGDGAVTLGADLEDFEDLDASEIGADDVAFVEALIDDVSERYCIDEDRVHAAGMSNGAGMSAAVACELGERFAAVGPVSGVNLTGDCTGTGPVSIFAIQGDADSAASYEGNYLLGFELGNPSVPDRMDQLADVMGCTSSSEPTTPYPSVTVTQWEGCEADVDVKLWTIAGGGHTWGGDFETSAELLDFFDSHPRAQG